MNTESATIGRVLIADDEETFREASITLLQRAGFQAEGVAAGEAALQRLREEKFDLLISDIRMPGNGELELVRTVAEIVPGLPIILVTGFPAVATATQAVQLPVVAYLIKPVNPDELRIVARRVVDQRRAFQAVEENLKRLDGWNGDLRAIMATLKPKPADALHGSLGAFLTLSLRNITGTLADIRQVIDLMVSYAPSEAAVQALQSAYPIVLTAALRDTIATIEGTKASFKSRALGELRERLEQLLDGAPATTP